MIDASFTEWALDRKSSGICSLLAFVQTRAEAGWDQIRGVNSDEAGLEGSERCSYRKWLKNRSKGVPGMGTGFVLFACLLI